jgi:murein L,D-transpeptidase YafK
LALTAVPQRSAEANVFGSLKADKVLVVKGERRLYLLHQGMVMRVYRIELGRNPMGTKVMEGDGRTPEGWYVRTWSAPACSGWPLVAPS